MVCNSHTRKMKSNLEWEDFVMEKKKNLIIDYLSEEELNFMCTYLIF